jgi:hypothetical protein
MRAAPTTLRARDAGELARLLAQHTPSLVILSDREDAQQCVEELQRQQRIDDRFVYRHQGYVAVGADLDALLEPVARPGETSPLVRVEPAASPGVYRLTITPPVIGAITVSTRVRVDGGAGSSTVRFVYALETADGHKTVEDQVTGAPVDGMLDLSAVLERELLNGTGPYHLTLTLRDASSALLTPVRSTVEAVHVRFVPEVPVERHPRR